VLKKFNLILLLSCFLFSCKQNHVQLIVKNATIYTVDSQFSKVNVMIISDGKIIAIGNDSLLTQYSADSIVDAKGQFIYPGFMDAHCHFTGYAMDKYKLNLYGVKSFDEMIAKTVEYSKINKRTWIEGRLWNENDWPNKSFPTKDTFDKLFPNTPIFLMRIDGHAILCNQKALDLAKITTSTKISNGTIEQKNGKLTGILIDKAVDIIKPHIPTLTQEEAVQFFQETENEFTALGLTSLVDCGLENKVVHWLENTYHQNKLAIRSSVMLLDDEINFQEYLHQSPIRNNQFHIIGFKIFADGSLGSRGAFLLNDYNDQHHHRGYLLKPLDSIEAIAKRVIQSKYQLNVHAIGDASNREVLKIFAQHLKQKNDRRWRIEHAQVVDPTDIHYFNDYNIIPSVQPTHATSDMTWVETRIGKKRTINAYAYKTLLKTNNWIPLGTDFPVESLNPFYTFYAAVFRVDKNELPKNGFQISNALSREQALRGITIWAAKSVFEENVKGSLEVGKFADFVITPIDIMKADAKSIYNAKISSTFINGKCVYKK
jgi:predicted amidohydrolase YtcJ